MRIFDAKIHTLSRGLFAQSDPERAFEWALLAIGKTEQTFNVSLEHRAKSVLRQPKYQRCKNQPRRFIIIEAMLMHEREGMRKIVLFLMGLLAVTFLFACGKKEVKIQSQESKTAEEAFALSESLRDAFIKNDRDTIRKNTTEDGYKIVTANRKAYESLELSFTPRWVEIEQAKVMLNVTWKSTWTAAGKKTEDRGMTVFVMEGKPLKLSGVLRTNPFVFPEQQQPRF